MVECTDRCKKQQALWDEDIRSTDFESFLDSLQICVSQE